MNDLFSLSGKVALITGGSRGLGKEMAIAFAKAGADVVIVSRNLESCEAVANEIESLGRRALPYASHVGRWEEINKMVEEVYTEFGKIDILVNNAGKSPLYDSLTSVSENMWDSVLDLNLKGPFRLSALIGTRMSEGAGGSIINISSTAAINPSTIEVPYAVAKAGVNTLTIAMAKAFGPKVRVNGIMPGPFLTDISKAWDDEMLAEFRKKSILQRAGNPDEIIGTALYLASESSSFTTGTIITVDGGYSK